MVFPPEFEKEVVLASGDRGRVVSFDTDALYVLWDDGDLLPIKYTEWDDLVKAGDLTVLETLPKLEFPE